MSAKFDTAIGFTLPWECAFKAGHQGDLAFVRAELDPDDPGGVTKYGIDQRDHPGVDVVNLTLEGAKAIYGAREWTWMLGERLDFPAFAVVFDACVNPGRVVISYLQHAVGAKPDGVFGEQTIAAVNVASRDQLGAFLDRVNLYYQNVAEEKPRLRKFLSGWINRNNARRKLLTA